MDAYFKGKGVQHPEITVQTSISNIETLDFEPSGNTQ
jgi:hypothetical protein